MDVNVSCTATSSMIVDLSGDNDSIGAIAAANSLPKPSEDSPFERSCDNPECSAPKLISLVPKRETPEFITEPKVMNKPTLVNGFTTVFQVDGLAAKMNDIMNGNYRGPSTSNGFGTASNPKSVFRIVPNTHAHIVNYVVVDGGGATMKKIKSNDPDTMQKLLDSQRLSAEQMLKKLISKAFKTSCRKPEPPVPLPIPSKVPGYTSLGVPTQEPTIASATAPLTAATSSLPTIPPGITITPIPITEVVSPNRQSPVASIVATSSPKELTRKENNDVTSKQTILTTPRASSPKGSSSNVSQLSVAAANASAPKVTSQETASAPTPPPPKLLPPQTVQTSPVDTPKALPTRPNLLKRKQAPVATPEAIKRLRPRSPKQKTPMAVGLKPATTSPPPPRKLPTLPKLPTKPPASTPSSQSTPQPKKAGDTDVASKSLGEMLSSPKAKESPSLKTVAGHLSTAKALTPSSTPKEIAPAAKSVTSEELPVKVKPLIGPASKINVIRALAAAQNSKPTVSAKVSAALAAKSGVTRIGETLITTTSAAKEDASPIPQTKPCSVSMPKADETNLSAKITEFLQKEAALKASLSSTPSKPTTSPISTTVLTTISKLTTTGPKVIAQTKTNLESIKPPRRSSTPEEDPLAFDDTEKRSEVTSKPTPSSSKPDSAPLTRLGKTLLSKSTAKEADASSEKKPQAPSTQKSDIADAKASVKAHATTPMRTRGSVPKAALAATSNTKQGKASTPSATPTRALRVVLPALKSGIMTIPVRSPHPNLKIASVISGGSAVAAATHKSSPKPSTTEEKKSPDIDKLQQELADLRRTVQRLSRKKT